MTPAARGQLAAGRSSSCSSPALRLPRYPATIPSWAPALLTLHCICRPPPAGPAILRPLRPVPHESIAGGPDEACGPVEPAGRLQVAQEALSPQLPRLRGGLLPARHHRCQGAGVGREAQGSPCLLLLPAPTLLAGPLQSPRVCIWLLPTWPLSVRIAPSLSSSL